MITTASIRQIRTESLFLNFFSILKQRVDVEVTFAVTNDYNYMVRYKTLLCPPPLP